MNYHNNINFQQDLNRLNSVFVYHHLGLGDHIVCNGMVRYILNKSNSDFLFLPVKTHNHETVSSMYSDDHRIVCLPVNSDADVPNLSQINSCRSFHRAGFEKTRSDWDVSFYDSVGVPFSERWNSFKVNRNPEREKMLFSLLNLNVDDPYIVVHDVSSIGKFDKMKIDTNGKRVVKIEKLTGNLLDWCSVIEGADEFHGIDSSVVHLAQSLNTKVGFVHASTATPPQIGSPENWFLVSY